MRRAYRVDSSASSSAIDSAISLSRSSTDMGGHLALCGPHLGGPASEVAALCAGSDQ
jgi:hypothetical protein